MIRGFYSAKLGALAQQENMNLIANNMANVNTVGYKPMRTSFTDLIYQNINRPQADEPAMVGHGVKINKTDLSMADGALDPTNYQLDYAIIGEGQFFALRDAAGDIQYTRAGNFILSIDDGDTYYLAAANGDRVLDAEGEEIEIEFDEDNSFEIPTGTIGVYSFNNPYGLYAVGNNRYIATDVSGEAEAVETPRLMAGYLEKSAVEVATEMVRVIEASRAFSFNTRMVQVADEVEQTINNLR